MQNHRHGPRDEAIEALLRQSLRTGTHDAASGPCVEADLLAAWADRSLSVADAAAVEHHVAGCARCQAVAAGLARASAPVHEPAPSFWTRWHLSWITPVAAAAAIALWVALPARRAEPVLEGVDSRLEPFSTAAEAPQSSVPSQPPESGSRLADRADVESRNTAGATSNRTGTSAAKAERGASADAAGLSMELQPAPGGARQEAADTPAGVAVAGTTPAPAAPAPRDVEAPAPVATPSPGPATPASAAAREQSASALSGNGVTRARTVDAGAPIAAPASAQRWRIVGGRRVERSLDGGRSWTSAVIQATADLTSGASSGADVCWLVGRGGAVFVAVDGVTFVRVTSPTATDLAGVRAIDDRTAVVSTTDARTFMTRDRGTTWVSVARTLPD